MNLFSRGGSDPRKYSGQERRAVLALPSPMGHHDFLCGPRQYLARRRTQWAAVEKGPAPFQGCIAFSFHNPPKLRPPALPSFPVTLQEVIREVLGQVGKDHRARGCVIKDHLVHKDRPAHPHHIKNALPICRRFAVERGFKSEIAPFAEGRFRPPELRVRTSGLPILQVEMVNFIGAHQMPRGAELGDRVGQFLRERHGRPDPERPIRQADDHAAGGVGEAVEIDDLAFGKPDIGADGFSTNSIASIYAWTGGLKHRGKLDENTALINFAETLEKVVVDTVEAGHMTKDLALLVGPDQGWLTTMGFLEKVDENLSKALQG